jgi:hypothetical protein
VDHVRVLDALLRRILGNNVVEIPIMVAIVPRKLLFGALHLELGPRVKKLDRTSEFSVTGAAAPGGRRQSAPARRSVATDRGPTSDARASGDARERGGEGDHGELKNCGE